MPSLIEAWKESDSENHGVVNTLDGFFRRCFIAPATTRAAYEACQPFIALDGCHTKSHFRMTLLIACTLDGNNEILPLSWAVVPVEDAENWTWFLNHMKSAFHEIEYEHTVIISDRDKGLQTAVSSVLPDAHHSYCCQHLADNIQKSFGLACRNQFWKAAHASSELDFEDAMEKIKKTKLEAWKYLNDIPHSAWAQYVFPAS
jgi:hypothetical protein